MICYILGFINSRKFVDYVSDYQILKQDSTSLSWLISLCVLQVVVEEKWIAIAILRLVELEKCVVEGAGAAGLAAILAGHLEELKGKRSV
jgi:threonine dehydratase